MSNTEPWIPDPPEGMFWRLKARGENVLIELRYSKRRFLGPREYGWRITSPRNVKFQAQVLLNCYEEQLKERNSARALAGDYPKSVPPPIPPHPPTTRTRNL